MTLPDLAPRSLTENAHAVLRADILACRLVPGARLKIAELCQQLDVSLGAVREALSRLSAEGLVESEAQKGFRVAPVSADDLDDLTRTRIEIETLCLRRAIAHGGVEWETRIVGAMHRLSRTPERAEGDEQRVSDAWATAHADFHFALVEACDSPWMLRLETLLSTQAERYRRLSVPAAPRPRNLEGEHRAIMDAVLARNAELACRLIADHFTTTAAIVRPLAVAASTTEVDRPDALRRRRRAN